MTSSSLWTGQRMLNCFVLIAALRFIAAGLVPKSAAMRVIPQQKEKTTPPAILPNRSESGNCIADSECRRSYANPVGARDRPCPLTKSLVANWEHAEFLMVKPNGFRYSQRLCLQC